MTRIPQEKTSHKTPIWGLVRLLAALLVFLACLFGAVPVYLPGRDRPIGQVDGRFFRKTITGSKHMLRDPRAIAFDRSTLDDAEKAGATHVSITDSETGRTYCAPIATVRRYGFPVVRGHGRQIALALDYYSIDGATPVAEQRAAQTNQERVDLQLGLFGGAA